MTAQVILIEAVPKQAADGSAVTMRLAGGGNVYAYVYGGHLDWRAGITTFPALVASLEFAGGEFPPGSIPAAAELSWAPAQASSLADLAALVWFDAPITVWIGPEGTEVPPVAISGRVLEAVATKDGKLKISLADPASQLKKPLLSARFAGTGALEGPLDWEGKIRDRIWGRIWNKRGEPIDAAHNIYCFADPARLIEGIDAVRDKGAAAAALTLLAWQGSAAATFAALQAAAAPAGGGVACPSIACVKWWTEPAGDLCADLRGEVGAGYVETTAAITQRLVEAIAGPAFSAGIIAVAIAARPAAVGWLANDDTTSVAEMLDELLGNSSLMWLLDSSGQIVLRPWEWGASAASADSHDVERVRTLRPVATRKIGYQRNETRQNRDSLAAIVLTDRSPTRPAAMAIGALWIAPDGHPYRFDGLPWYSAAGSWTSGGAGWSGSGYTDAQDSNAAGSADWSNVTGPGKPADNADVTADHQVTVTPPASAVVYCDSAGAPKAGQLPKVLTPVIKRGGGDIRTALEASYTITAPAQLDASINTVAASADKGRITIGAGWTGPGTAQLTVMVSGLNYGPFPIVVTRQNDAPAAPGGSGGGSGPAYDSTFLQVTSAGLTAISDELGPLDLTAGQKLVVTATLDYEVFGASEVFRRLVAQAEYWDGAAWQTFTGATQQGDPAHFDPGGFVSDIGSINFSQEKTGLAAGSYKVRLMAAQNTASPAATISVSAGTMIFSVV